MRTVNSIEMRTTPLVIYALACNTGVWPSLLPHYRYVESMGYQGSSQIIEMAAWRDCIPVSWKARQTNDPVTPMITFDHIEGWTRGMRVYWRFEALGGGRTRVVIEHELRFRFPFAAEWIGQHVVGDFFVKSIADKTLKCFKDIVENES